MNIKENYQKYANQYASELTALKRKNTGFITGELLADRKSTRLNSSH